MLVWPGMAPSWRSLTNGDVMSSKLEMIDERLGALRPVSEKMAREIEWCRENRWRDEFAMDRKLHGHLREKDVVDREIADLEHARRCELPVGGSVGHGEWRPATPGFVGSDH
jgi:hypothetical protein